MKFEQIREEDGFLDLQGKKNVLGREEGSSFGWFDQTPVGFGGVNDGTVSDLADWEARDMHEMLSKDYKAKQIENVLTLPLSSADYTIQPGAGDSGEAKWMQEYWDTDFYAGGCRTGLHQIIGLMTSAFYFKRAYFEKVWVVGTGKFKGKTVYGDIAWRPQTTCKLLRNGQTGRFEGFTQESYFTGPTIKNPDKYPIKVKPNRAFVYVHGTRRDPLMGTSDMEVAFWAWKTKQKILLLWFQFLQSVSLPRIVVKGQDQTTANQIAKQIARLKSSGVLPVATQAGPDQVAIDVLDISGKGAEQFLQAITWLDAAATNSVLAGFLDLTGMAKAGVGSYALSKDASDFFLQSLEAKAREMEDQIRRSLFAPLIRLNFGPEASIPRLRFEPLNDIDKVTAVELLKQAMAAPPGGPVPTQFIAELAGQVATSLGIDSEETRAQFKTSFDAAAAQAQAKALTEVPGGASPAGQAVAGMSGAVGAAQNALKAGFSKKQAKQHGAQVAKASAVDQKNAAKDAKGANATRDLLVKHTKKALAAKTDGDAQLAHELADDTDLAGFNPAEMRAAGGTWAVESGQSAVTGQQTAEQKQDALKKKKAQLQAEVKHYHALIDALHIGVHKGAGSVHKGQPGAHHTASASTKKGSTKGGAKGKAGKVSLATQVTNLEHQVVTLKVLYAKDKKIAAKRKK